MSTGPASEQLCAAIEESAGLVDAPFDRERTLAVLTAFEDGLTSGPIILSTQVGGGPGGELEYTVQVTPGVDDPYALAVEHGFAADTDHPVGRLYGDIREHIDVGESFIDCGVAGGFKKLYAQFMNDPQSVDRLAGIPSVPDAVAANAGFFARYGLTDVVLMGVDLRRRTMNLYFQLPPSIAGDVDADDVRSMLSEVGVEYPDEQMVQYATKSYRIYTTLSWDSSDIRRISFAPRPSRDLDPNRLPAELPSGVEKFMTAAPYTYDGPRVNASAVKWTEDGDEFVDVASYHQAMEAQLRIFS
ncbi:Aromatic prenyltransferase CloQ [Streptomyces sp. YIM 130001]|uniref:aromatic prenyltransferase n=1 Tax=Streptomyces sp. YIM 130001 TaxID=2259644 RepID=UPI000E6581BD|nr:aromatic prenyltransferase [Streptomyces sp. YIM 130001]RII13466.1 Aromatic prenyltransferase CloQ [Streptomyces sp. YIM 130001]